MPTSTLMQYWKVLEWGWAACLPLVSQTSIKEMDRMDTHHSSAELGQAWHSTCLDCHIWDQPIVLKLKNMNFAWLHLWNPAKAGDWGFTVLNVTAGTIASQKKTFCLTAGLRTKKSPGLRKFPSEMFQALWSGLALKSQCLCGDCQTREQLSSACEGFPTYGISHETKHNGTIPPSNPVSFWALLCEAMIQASYELIITATISLPCTGKKDPSGKNISLGRVNFCLLWFLVQISEKPGVSRDASRWDQIQFGNMGEDFHYCSSRTGTVLWTLLPSSRHLWCSFSKKGRAERLVCYGLKCHWFHRFW